MEENPPYFTQSSTIEELLKLIERYISTQDRNDLLFIRGYINEKCGDLSKEDYNQINRVLVRVYDKNRYIEGIEEIIADIAWYGTVFFDDSFFQELIWKYKYPFLAISLFLSYSITNSPKTGFSHQCYQKAFLALINNSIDILKFLFNNVSEASTNLLKKLVPFLSWDVLNESKFPDLLHSFSYETYSIACSVLSFFDGQNDLAINLLSEISNITDVLGDMILDCIPFLFTYFNCFVNNSYLFDYLIKIQNAFIELSIEDSLDYWLFFSEFLKTNLTSVPKNLSTLSKLLYVFLEVMPSFNDENYSSYSKIVKNLYTLEQEWVHDIVIEFIESKLPESLEITPIVYTLFSMSQVHLEQSVIDFISKVLLYVENQDEYLILASLIISKNTNVLILQKSLDCFFNLCQIDCVFPFYDCLYTQLCNSPVSKDLLEKSMILANEMKFPFMYIKVSPKESNIFNTWVQFLENQIGQDKGLEFVNYLISAFISINGYYNLISEQLIDDLSNYVNSFNDYILSNVLFIPIHILSQFIYLIMLSDCELLTNFSPIIPEILSKLKSFLSKNLVLKITNIPQLSRSIDISIFFGFFEWSSDTDSYCALINKVIALYTKFDSNTHLSYLKGALSSRPSEKIVYTITNLFIFALYYTPDKPKFCSDNIWDIIVVLIKSLFREDSLEWCHSAIDSIIKLVDEKYIGNDYNIEVFLQNLVPTISNKLPHINFSTFSGLIKMLFTGEKQDKVIALEKIMALYHHIPISEIQRLRKAKSDTDEM